MRIESSYSNKSGTAINTWLRGSGGVKTAAKTRENQSHVRGRNANLLSRSLYHRQHRRRTSRARPGTSVGRRPCQDRIKLLCSRYKPIFYVLRIRTLASPWVRRWPVSIVRDRPNGKSKIVGISLARLFPGVAGSQRALRLEVGVSPGVL